MTFGSPAVNSTIAQEYEIGSNLVASRCEEQVRWSASNHLLDFRIVMVHPVMREVNQATLQDFIVQLCTDFLLVSSLLFQSRSIF